MGGGVISGFHRVGPVGTVQWVSLFCMVHTGNELQRLITTSPRGWVARWVLPSISATILMQINSAFWTIFDN